MALAYFSMLLPEFLNKDPDISPYEAPIVILDRKYTMYMDKNGKDNKYDIHISRRTNFVTNG